MIAYFIAILYLGYNIKKASMIFAQLSRTGLSKELYTINYKAPLRRVPGSSSIEKKNRGVCFDTPGPAIAERLIYTDGAAPRSPGGFADRTAVMVSPRNLLAAIMLLVYCKE